MKQEKLKIEGHVAYKLATGWYEVDEFEEVQKETTGGDYEDGGTEYELIVKEKSTGKYFQLNYCEWDIDNTDYDDENDCIYPDGRIDLPTAMCRVYPKEITKTIYTTTP